MSSPIERAEIMLELVAFAYEAAQDAVLWPELAIRIAKGFGAASTALVAPDELNPSVLSKTPDLDDEAAREYCRLYRHLVNPIDRSNERLRTTYLKPSQADGDGAGVIEWSSVGESPLGRGLAGIVSLPSGQAAVLGLHRPCAGPTFDAVDRIRMMQFLPHVQKAVGLRHRLEHRSPDEWSGFDRGPIAAMLVGRDGRLLRQNSLASALLARGEGLHVVNHRVAGATRAETQRLRSLILRVADRPPGASSSANCLSLSREGELPLTIMAIGIGGPCRSASEPTGSAVLQIVDPSAYPLASRALQSLFGLTPAEAAVAAELSTGKTPNEIAAALSISVGTVRTHLKNVNAKTGAKRQAALVALLLRGVGPLVWYTQTHLI